MDADFCSWMMDTHSLTSGTDRPCGRPVVAVYSQENPLGNRPDQPRFLRYPSCAIHDTPRRQKAAKDMGFKREETA